MKAEIGVSTGVFHTFYEDEEINREISHIARWDVDVVEILFSRIYTLDIPITAENKEFLKRKTVTLHAPFFYNKGYDLCKLTKTEIKKLVEIGKELNAKHILIHGDLLEDLGILNEFDFLFVIENVKPKISEEFSLQKIKKIFDKNKKLKLGFDPEHAKDLSKEEIEKYLSELNNIEEIHFPILDLNNFLNGEEKNYFYLKKYCNSVTIETRLEKLGKMPQVIEMLRKIF